MRFLNRLPLAILMVLLMLTASGILFYLADGNLACGWPNNVVRNWEQYGFLRLKGKLVMNSGGYEALTKPSVYAGHRAASLYPVFLARQLFAWTGAGTLAFHVLLSLALLLSTWFLLGRSRVAWVAGAAAILCPGYACYQTTLDPNTISVLMGLPFAAIVLPRLVKPAMSPWEFGLLLLAIAAYTTLNWTTAFVHGMLLVYVVVARNIPRRWVGLYIALAAVSTLLIGGMSVLEKREGHASFSDFLGGYAWGSGGYGTFLTVDRAAVRLLFVATAGLLPLLLVCGYLLARHRTSSRRRRWFAFSPLAVGILGVGVLRNYFGHHPWMAAPVFLVGLVLSMGLVVQTGQAAPTVGEMQARGKILGPAAFLGGCFAYGAVVVVMSSLQNWEAQALVALLRAHTARSDTIVMAETDAMLVEHSGTISEYADRRVLVVPDLSRFDGSGSRAFLLSPSGELRLPLVARTLEPALASWPLVERMLGLYSKSVARRMPGNRGLRPGTCYLYELGERQLQNR
jgi:hypothetical protein